ncbi:MAG: sugar phosphate isomerase/epimerase family protein [Kiloniellaceae bacterium]
MAIKVAGCPDSWGVWFSDDPKQPPWQRFLDELAEAGYDGTELGPYGYLPTDLPVLRRAVEERGLEVTAGMIEGILYDPDGWPVRSLSPRTVEAQLHGVGRLLAGLGGRYLLLMDNTYTDMHTGERIAPAELGGDDWKRLVDTTQKVAQIARDAYGLTLVFHPETESHVQFEHQIEALLSQTDPALVSLCLDIGHHANCGGDPVAFMRKHHTRIPYLHLKSIDPEVRKKVQEANIPFTPAVGMGLFCEPELGAVDFLGFRDVLHLIGYEGWVTVEQDMYPAPFDKPLPIAKRTRAYLREIGIG